MLRPGGSSLSLRAIGSSLRNLNSISTEHLDERILLLMPPVGTTTSTTPSTRNSLSPANAAANTTTTSNKRYGDRLSVYEYKEATPANRHSLQSPTQLSHSINDLSPANEKDVEILVPSMQRRHHGSHDHLTTADNTAIIDKTDVASQEQDVRVNEDEFGGVQETPAEHAVHVAEDMRKELTQLYFKRWIILGVFCMITLINSFNWIEYGIIQDVTIAFYNASLPQDEAQQIDAVNWFSMVYMLAYIPLVFPAMFLLERKGLRLSCILGALLTFVGASIKCAAVRPDLFAVAMLGQTICAIAQSFTLGIPARLSALWFGPDEIGLATSIGVFGNQLGTALGFLIPPNVVLKSDSVEFMQQRFYILLVPVAAMCGLAFILAIFLVKDQPEKPPSLAQLEIRKSLDTKELEESDLRLFKSSLKDLFKNINYCLILLSYGVNTGVYYSIGTLLNLIISKYYENENEKIGIIGLILVLSGLLGAVIGGIILDKTKAFKVTTFVIYACSFIAMILFTFTISVNIWIVFGTSFLLGFFMTGYLPVGFELAAEVTYPASEGTSCGLLNTSAQIFGIFFTYIQGRIVVKVSALAGNIFVCGALLIGTIITALVRSDLRRQKAINIIIEKTTQKDSPDPNENNYDEDNTIKEKSFRDNILVC